MAEIKRNSTKSKRIVKNIRSKKEKTELDKQYEEELIYCITDKNMHKKSKKITADPTSKVSLMVKERKAQLRKEMRFLLKMIKEREKENEKDDTKDDTKDDEKANATLLNTTKPPEC